MALKLKGSTSGFVAIDAPSVAGNNTLILPENTGSAQQLLGNDITAGVVTFTSVTVNRNGDLTVPGTISIGGTLTYEDVTSVDSIGIVTARGLSIFGNTTGLNATGVSTFTSDVFFLGASSKTITFDQSEGHIRYLDNAKAQFGTQGDLQLYHNGSHAYIDNSEGSLFIKSSNQVYIQDDQGRKQITCVDGAAVELYHAGVDTVRLQTTTTGVSVGTLNATGISTFASPVLISDGSVSAGGLAFADDTDTGIFSVAQNTINFATAGVERLELGTTLTVFNDDGADVNFRIEGDTDANLFHLDASADAIGVGGAPNTTGMKMEIFRSTADPFVNASDCVLRLLNTDTSSATNQTSLQFTTSTDGVGSDSAIVSQSTSAGNSRLEFWTDTANGMSKKMTIDQAGRVLIGTVTEGEGTADNLTIGDTGNCGITIRSGTSSEGNIFFSDGTSGSAEYRGTIQYNQSDDRFVFFTAATERMRIDSTGALTFTAANNGQIIHSFKNTDTTAGSYAMTVEQWFRFNRSGGGMNAAAAKIIAGKEREWIGGASNQDGYLAFHTMENETAAERMRIVSQGRMRIRCEDFANDPGSSNKGVMIGDTSTGSTFSNGASTGFANNIIFMNGNGVVGKIETNGTATNYATSSDYRLKENAVAISNGITNLKTLKPYRFNFKSDANTTLDGFFAHEVSPVVPEAVAGTKDELYTEDWNEYKVGDPKIQTLDSTKLIPLLTAALQEAITKIETLETKVAALEGS